VPRFVPSRNREPVPPPKPEAEEQADAPPVFQDGRTAADALFSEELTGDDAGEKALEALPGAAGAEMYEGVAVDQALPAPAVSIDIPEGEETAPDQAWADTQRLPTAPDQLYLDQLAAAEEAERLKAAHIVPEHEELRELFFKTWSIYAHYNNQRTHIMGHLTTAARLRLLATIPLFFHINTPRAPGYVQGLPPTPGVHGFKMTDEVRKQRKEFLGKLNLTSIGATEKPLIVSLASIGSAGTLSQSDHSDFDLWVILRDDATPEEYKLIEKKAAVIKKWLISQDPDIDVNFYLGTPDRIRRHYFGAVSDDSAGSALGKLLKEEFYRTCIVWAGQTPFWWILPTDVRTPEAYRIWYDAFIKVKMPFREDIMDLGPLERATMATFSASTLWQTNKSLASPFKSLMKLALVSAYASDPSAELLAERLRNNVQVNPTHGSMTDPYLCLFEYTASYLRSKKDYTGMGLMGEMFFLKTLGSSDGMRITKKTVDPTITRKRLEVREYLHSFGIGRERMNELENINEWKFLKGLQYRHKNQWFVKRVFDHVQIMLRRMHIEITQGKIRKLREDADPDAVALLSEFSTIGEKVDCFYQRAIPKVDAVPVAFRKILHQRGYALIYDPSLPKEDRWSIQEEVPFCPQATTDENGLIKFDVIDPNKAPGAAAPEDDGGLDQALYEEASDEELLIRGRSALYLICWLAVNRMSNPRTMFRVKIGSRMRPVRELRQVLFVFRHFVHPLYDGVLPESEFVTPPVPVKIFISFDFAKHSHFREEERKDKITKDASEDRIDRITVLIQNSWGIAKVHEVSASKFSPAHVVVRLLNLFGSMHYQRDVMEKVFLHTADTRYHEAYLPQFKSAHHRIHLHFQKTAPRPGLAVRYVTKVMDDYILVTRDAAGKFHGRYARSMKELVRELERPVGSYVQTVVDGDYEGPERLREMLKTLALGQVVVFVSRASNVGDRMGSTNSIHVVDETGCLYTERCEDAIFDPQLKGLVMFIKSLSDAPLRHARKVAGHLKLSLYEVVNISDRDHRYSYRLMNYPAPRHAPDAGGPRGIREMAVVVKMLTVRLAGSMNLRKDHKAILTSEHGEEIADLRGATMLQDLALHIRRVMDRDGCTEFTIAGLILENAGSHVAENGSANGSVNDAANAHLNGHALNGHEDAEEATRVVSHEEAAPKYSQAIDYLGWRRTVDRAVRHLLTQIAEAAEREHDLTESRRVASSSGRVEDVNVLTSENDGPAALKKLMDRGTLVRTRHAMTMRRKEREMGSVKEDSPEHARDSAALAAAQEEARSAPEDDKVVLAPTPMKSSDRRRVVEAP
jgi:hypothetical protein